MPAIELDEQLIEDIITNTIHSAANSINIDNNRDEFVMLLVTLISSEDTSLQYSALELLHSLYTQTAILGQNIQKLQLIVTTEENTLLNKCKVSSKELNKLVQSSELWFCIDGDKADRTKFSELMISFAKELKPQFPINVAFPISAEPEGELMINSKVRQISHLSDMSIANIYNLVIEASYAPLNQFYKEMYRNLGVIDSVSELLQFCIESGNFASVEYLLEPITQVFDFIWLLIKNNKENKALLTSSWIRELILPLIKVNDSFQDTHAYMVLRELYIDGNEQLAKDMQLNNEIVDALIDSIKNLSISDIRKSIYMDTIACIINQKEPYSKSLQYMVIRKIFATKDRMQQIDRSHLDNDLDPLPLADSQTALADNKADTEGRINIEQEQIKKMILRFQEEWRSNKMLFYHSSEKLPDLIILPPQINYILTFLKVLTHCGEGKNAFSENIGQNFLSIKTLIDLLMVPNLNLIVKLSLIDFCFHIYLDTEKGLNSLSSGALLNVCCELMRNFIDFGSDFSDQINQITGTMIFTPSEIFREEQICNKTVRLLMDSLDILISKKHLSAKKVNKTVSLNYVILSCDKILKNEYFKPVEKETLKFKALIVSIREKVVGGQKSMAHLHPTETVQEVAVVPSDSTPTRRFLDNKKSFQDCMIRKDNTTESIETGVKISQDTDSIFYDKFRHFCKKLVSSNQFENACSCEFENLVMSISALESRQADQDEDVFTKFSASLIRFLDPNNEDTSEKVQLMGLNIVRKYIESAVSQTKKSSAQWDVEEYKPYLHSIRLRQDKMISIGIVELISKLLTIESSAEIQMEIMLLNITLLFGGNLNCQGEFLKFMKREESNKVLINIKNMINRSFDYVKDTIVSLNEKDMSYRIYTDQTLNMEEYIKNDEQFQFNLKLCTYLFRFLQLLCEGHNLDLQNYLRKQSDVDITASSKDINFITDTCFLLGPYLKINNRYTKELGLQILDFLIESVQGPCYENQKKLFDSKLIDIGKDFLHDDHVEIDHNVKIEVFTEKASMTGIVKKVIKLILSLFEGHDGRQWSAIYTTINVNYLICYLAEELVRHFYEKFGIDVRKVQDLHVSYLVSLIKTPVFDQELEEAFEIYFFIMTVNDLSGVYSSYIRNLKGIKKFAFEFFKEFSNHIEVVFRGGLQKSYFIIQPACMYLTKKKKLAFQNSVNRDTPNDKIMGMIDNAAEFFDIMDHLCYLKTKYYVVSPRIFDAVRYFTLVLSFVINAIYFFFWDHDVENTRSVITGRLPNSVAALKVLGLMQVTFGVIMIVLWSILEAPIVIMNGYRKQFRVYQRIIQSYKESSHEGEDKVILSLIHKKISDITFKEHIMIMKYVHRIQGQTQSIAEIEFLGRCCIFLLKNGMLNFLFFFVVSTSFAVAYNLSLLYAVLLLDLIVISFKSESLTSFEKCHEGCDLQQLTADSDCDARPHVHILLLDVRLLFPGRHILHAHIRRPRRKHMHDPYTLLADNHLLGRLLVIDRGLDRREAWAMSSSANLTKNQIGRDTTYVGYTTLPASL